MKLFTNKFYSQASPRTLDLAESFLAIMLHSGASEQQLRQIARAYETAYERGGVDSLSKYAPQILQEDLIQVQGEAAHG